MIFMASDRMLTSGDIQFEPEAPKTRPLTTSIAVMQSRARASQPLTQRAMSLKI